LGLTEVQSAFISILIVGIDMLSLDDYVGHDRRPVSFLVYLWLAAEQRRRGGAVEISYRELAANIGVSKS
jgi:hypothetical protein